MIKFELLWDDGTKEIVDFIDINKIVDDKRYLISWKQVERGGLEPPSTI